MKGKHAPQPGATTPVNPINPAHSAKKGGSHAAKTAAFNGPYNGAYGAGNDAYPGQTVAFDAVSNPSDSFGFAADQGTMQPVQPHKKGNGKKVALIAFGIVAAALLLAYAVGAFMFQSRFYPNTAMGSFDLSMMTQEEAVALVSDASKNYELRVSGQGLSFTVSAEQGGMMIDAQAVIQDALEKNDAMAWPLNIMGSHDLTSSLVVTSDSTALGTTVSEAVTKFNKTAQPSQNATLVYDEKSGLYKVKDEVFGTQLSEEAVLEAAAAAVAAMQPKLELDESVLMEPEVLATDERLAAGRTAANDLIKCDVTLVDELTGSTIAEVDGDDVSQWIKFDKDFNPSLKKKAMKNWANDLAASFNTVGAERTYTRPDGKRVTVSGGDYGWQTDADSLAASVVDAIENGATGEITVPCAVTGNGYTQAGQDWGAYCDIDLTEQHAYYYDAEGNLLWQSAVVTGNPNNGDDTPTGVYSLKNLETDVSLKGPIDPKTNKPKWDSPVDYWMPFVGNLIGLHDASWQPSSVFGDPNAYKTYGSKGCVNLPTNKAAKLFDIIQIGDAVIVHW